TTISTLPLPAALPICKARTRSTGNAARGYSSLPSIGTHNLYLEPGTESPESLIAGVKNGFYVTSMLGQGADLVTGDYSRGANGRSEEHTSELQSREKL